MSRERAGDSDEAGFGMAEVLVSMLLLMVVAIAMLPIYVSGLRLTSSNVSLTTATQLVSQQMDHARGLAATCLAIQTFAAETVGVLEEDPSRTILQVHREAPAACPTSYPAAFSFKVWITVQGQTEHLVDAETFIHIDKEE